MSTFLCRSRGLWYLAPPIRGGHFMLAVLSVSGGAGTAQPAHVRLVRQRQGEDDGKRAEGLKEVKAWKTG